MSLFDWLWQKPPASRSADVAAWHRVSGGELQPDTRIWRELPRPWAVLRGEAPCTRAMVTAACERHGVKPETWIGPKPPAQPVHFMPTPELVHGVTVGNPHLANLLRHAGWFSGKRTEALDMPVAVRRDDRGFVLGVEE